MLNTSSRRQAVHGLLRFADGALVKPKVVVAHRAVSDAGKIKSQDYQPDGGQLSRNLHVNASRSDPVHDSGIQQDHPRAHIFSVVDSRIGDNSHQRLSFPEGNGFFSHEWVLEVQETIDCNIGLGTSKLPSTVGNQICGAARC